MNGTNGTINIKTKDIIAIVKLDSKGRIVIPYNIRKKRSNKFGLYVTEKAIVLQDI